MRYDIKNEVIKELQNLRHSELLQAELRRIDLRKNNKDFAELDSEYLKNTYELALYSVLKQDTAELDNNLKILKNKWLKALAALGESPEIFNPTIHCETCGDTGFVDDVPCKCFLKLYNQKLREICNLQYRADFRFSDCDLSIVTNEKQKKMLAFLYKVLKRYCELFPNTKYDNILLSGPTGVGKTCLASAMANELMDRGFMVMFTTAFEFNQLMLKYHTSPFQTRGVYMEDLLECDFLIIDDLGTEQIIRNVTEEYLFQVLSHRKNHGKHTMFSTNLDIEQLKDFYGERIFSRLLDKKNTFCRYIEGDDLRIN